MAIFPLSRILRIGLFYHYSFDAVFTVRPLMMWPIDLLAR
jgi:hypothetical protein